jgi:hypothetical protein
MKKILLSLLAIATFQISVAQTAEEIAAKHVEAIGGAANWKKINSIVMDASMKAQGADIKITRTHVNDKAMRMDISAMGMNGYQILTQKEGWSFMPFQGQAKPEPMTPDDIKSSQDQLSIWDEFITYKDLGKKLEYIGKDDLEGTECLKLKMTDKEGQETTFWLDPNNYYTLQETQKIKANGQEAEVTTVYSNYKKTEEGIVYSFSNSGNWGDIEINKITINPKIDESIFTLAK